MRLAALGKGIQIGRTPGGKPGRRRPRPIGGPSKGRPPRKLTTSEAAIRRFEQQKRGGTRGRPSRPTGTGGRPSRPTGTGRGPRRTSRTSRTAIGRSRARIARRR